MDDRCHHDAQRFKPASSHQPQLNADGIFMLFSLHNKTAASFLSLCRR
ncbi:MAG: hypothetical protein J1E43_08895 [Christensenellaceae bacterium]|nr:hypothetical protein [Christensenellaceae bacterium]